MKALPLFPIALLLAAPAFSEESRQLDAHEHGVGELNIAADGNQIAMELHAPGSDIVGFEYAASSKEDLAAIEKVLAVLATPLSLFKVSDAAGCEVTQASAELEGDDSHGDENDHDGHEDHDAHGDHDDDNHNDGDHDDHDAHKDDHAHEDHEDHDDDAGHTEFHAEYLLTCSDPAAIKALEFAYFEAFPNAREVEVQLLTKAGAQSFEVERDTPTLDLRGMF